MLFLTVCRYCIVLTKMKAMSLCLFYLFEKMLLIQLFWNIGQIILELSRNSIYTIRCLLWWHKILPGAIWTKTYSEPLRASKMECFADTVNDWKSLTDEYALYTLHHIPSNTALCRVKSTWPNVQYICWIIKIIIVFPNYMFL